MSGVWPGWPQPQVLSPQKSVKTKPESELPHLAPENRATASASIPIPIPPLFFCFPLGFWLCWAFASYVLLDFFGVPGRLTSKTQKAVVSFSQYPKPKNKYLLTYYYLRPASLFFYPPLGLDSVATRLQRGGRAAVSLLRLLLRRASFCVRC
jgi:hypothetical protein